MSKQFGVAAIASLAFVAGCGEKPRTPHSLAEVKVLKFDVSEAISLGIGMACATSEGKMSYIEPPDLRLKQAELVVDYRSGAIDTCWMSDTRSPEQRGVDDPRLRPPDRFPSM